MWSCLAFYNAGVLVAVEILLDGYFCGTDSVLFLGAVDGLERRVKEVRGIMRVAHFSSEVLVLYSRFPGRGRLWTC